MNEIDRNVLLIILAVAGIAGQLYGTTGGNVATVLAALGFLLLTRYGTERGA